MTTNAALASFCSEARSEPFIAVDTEFHRERTYFSKLALVQVALPGKIACIDPIAISDLNPLDELLLDRKVLKLMHSGRQDLEIFFDRTEKSRGLSLTLRWRLPCWGWGSRQVMRPS